MQMAQGRCARSLRSPPNSNGLPPQPNVLPDFEGFIRRR
jgi:hypothetical protein